MTRRLWIAFGVAWVTTALILALAVLVGSSIAAPRSAQTTLSVDVSGQRSAEPTGAPLPEAGDRLRLPAPPSAPAVETVRLRPRLTASRTPTPADGAPQKPLSPARSSALDAPGRLAREGTPAQPTGQTAAHGPRSGSGGIPRPSPERFRGLATWFCLSGSSACTRGYDQDDLVAAIDADLGFGKGDRVRVRYGDRAVVVTVVDVCGCPGDRLIDLTSGAFARLVDLGVGVIPVTVEAAGPDATMPPTETAP